LKLLFYKTEYCNVFPSLPRANKNEKKPKAPLATTKSHNDRLNRRRTVPVTTRTATMGTVHGVYLKYVGISALSFAGYSMLVRGDDGTKISLAELIGYGSRTLMAASGRALTEQAPSLALWKIVPALILGYSTLLNGVIAALFKMEIGMAMLGKNRKTGQIPLWSYVLFFPFHLPTLLYTHIHTLHSTHKVEKDGKTADEIVPVATQIQPGWWVGGCYAHELDEDWAGVIDLTVEFPETCINRTTAYLSTPTWDGVPCTAEQLEEAANFAVAANKTGGAVLVHCAHGRGRSTTVMCACLVKAGLFRTWEEAFEKGIKPQRTVCKLNRRMKQALTEWQETYMEERGKKGQ
jgi:protein-tyrosine phosphatase